MKKYKYHHASIRTLELEKLEDPGHRSTHYPTMRIVLLLPLLNNSEFFKGHKLIQIGDNKKRMSPRTGVLQN